MFNPEMQLTDVERAELVQMSVSAGYRVLHKIMRAETDRFVLALINVSAADTEAVLSTHKLAKAAAQFYAAITERVNEEMLIHRNMPRDTDKPVDPTEKLIDLGDRTESSYILEEMNVRELN